MPPVPTRLMAGLAILKHTFNLSDEDLCARWVENPYFQFFCGETFFRHDLPFDRSSMTRWRQRMGEDRIMSHCPQQNGMIERVIRTLKEQCVHRHRFENIQHASRAIGDWIHFYNNRRPHQALGMKTPADAFR